MTKDTSPPAFPVVENMGAMRVCPGLSMRDYFAGQALTGLLARWPVGEPQETISHWAYLYADGMLAQREQGETE